MKLHWIPLLWGDLKRIVGDPSGVGLDTWGLLAGLLLLYALRSKARVESNLKMGRGESHSKGVGSFPGATTEIVIEPELMEELKELLQRNSKLDAIKLLRERKDIDLSQAKRIVDALREIQGG